jgi:hypothetical protein
MGTLHEVDGTTGLVHFHQKGTEQLVYEQGTSFPVSPAPVEGQAFYRTDLDTLYIYDGSIWIVASPSGTVNNGTAGNLSLYATTGTAVSDTYVQNTKNITLGIAAQGSRTQDLAITVPNPGNAVTTTNVMLTDGAQTVNGTITMANSATIAMGTSKITGLANGTAATDATAFGQLSSLFHYRRPVLQFVSVSTVSIKTGIDGTSGEAIIVFPDGEVRTDSTAGDITFDITRNAAWASGTIQSGLDTGSEATNTWYAIYAVKVTKVGDTTRFVAVGSTTLPLQVNYSTLNSNFGTNGWVYLGLIRNGDNAGATGDILRFQQVGNFTKFWNQLATTNSTLPAAGTQLATSAAATTLLWSYASGTGAAQIPANILIGAMTATTGTGAGAWRLEDAAARYWTLLESGVANQLMTSVAVVTGGFSIVSSANSVKDLALSGIWDVVLGVGSNPLL